MSWTSPYLNNRIIYTQYNEEQGTSKPLEGVSGGSITWSQETETKSIAEISTVNDNFEGVNKIGIQLQNEAGTTNLGYYDIEHIEEEQDKWTRVRNYDLVGMVDRFKNYEVVLTELVQGYYTFEEAIKKFVNRVDLGVKYNCPSKKLQIVTDEIPTDEQKNLYSFISFLLQKFNYTFSTPANYSNINNTVTVVDYVNPNDKQPIYTFGISQGNVSGRIKAIPKMFSAPNTIEVFHKFSDGTKNYWGDVDKSLPFAFQHTHKRVDSVENIDKLYPETMDELKRRWVYKINKAAQYKDEYTFMSFFCGLYPSDVVNVEYGDKTPKCVIKDMKINLTPSLSTEYSCQETQEHVANERF